MTTFPGWSYNHGVYRRGTMTGLILVGKFDGYYHGYMILDEVGNITGGMMKSSLSLLDAIKLAERHWE